MTWIILFLWDHILCDQWSLLEVLWGPSVVLGIEMVLATCKTSALPPILFFWPTSEHFMKRLKNHLENLGSLTLFPQNPSIIPPSITRPIYFCTVESITLKNISYISHHSLASVTSDYFQEKIRVPNKANKH